MPNLAALLKNEISRLAKKEVKAQTVALRKAVVLYRREIASLKRQLRQQQTSIARLESQIERRVAQAPAKPQGPPIRFSARSVRAQRARLEFSAKEYGRLLGVSGLTIYNWEQGKSRPRKTQLDALVAVRGLGKREARARLQSLSGGKKDSAGH